MYPRERTRLWAALFALWFACCLASAALAQETTKTSTPSSPRDVPAGAAIVPGSDSDPAAHIEVGMMAPDFELDGSAGKPVRLSSLRGDWVALVFNDRMTPLLKLTKIDSDMQRMGVKLVAVCREKTRYVRTQAHRENLTFLVLTDVSGQVGALYGLRGSRGANLSPGFVVLDSNGRVKLVRSGEPLSADRVWQLTHDVMTNL